MHGFVALSNFALGTCVKVQVLEAERSGDEMHVKTFGFLMLQTCRGGCLAGHRGRRFAFRFVFRKSIRIFGSVYVALLILLRVYSL